MKCLTTIKYFATAQYFIANDFVLKSIPPSVKRKKKKHWTIKMFSWACRMNHFILSTIWTAEYAINEKKSADAPLQLWTFTIKHMELST